MMSDILASKNICDRLGNETLLLLEEGSETDKWREEERGLLVNFCHDPENKCSN